MLLIWKRKDQAQVVQNFVDSEDHDVAVQEPWDNEKNRGLTNLILVVLHKVGEERRSAVAGCSTEAFLAPFFPPLHGWLEIN